jgi:hypothetical protein
LAIEDFLATGKIAFTNLKRIKAITYLMPPKKNLSNFQRNLNKDFEQDFEVFYRRHLLTELQFGGFDAVLNRTADNDLHPVTRTLDAFYALKKLRYHCELLNRKIGSGHPL